MSTETSAQLPLVSLYLATSEQSDHEKVIRLLQEKGFTRAIPGTVWKRRRNDGDITLTDVIEQGSHEHTEFHPRHTITGCSDSNYSHADYHAFVVIEKAGIEKDIQRLMQRAQEQKTAILERYGKVAMSKRNGKVTYQSITPSQAVSFYLHSQLDMLEKELGSAFRSITRVDRCSVYID